MPKIINFLQKNSKLKLFIFVFATFCLLMIAIQGCSSNYPAIKGHPLYVNTKRGLTVIDTRTDKTIVEGYRPNYPDSIAAFYKTLLFTEFSGTDFPVNVSPATHLFDLKTGRKEKFAKAQLAFLKKENHFLYGLDSNYDLIFIYDISKRKAKKVKSSDPDLPPTFIGFLSLSNRQKAIVLSSGVWSLDRQSAIDNKKELSFTPELIADNSIIGFGSNNVNIFDPIINKETSFTADFPSDRTAFYAYGKLYVGKSTAAEDKPKLSTYKVYRLDDGKLIKTLKMDVRSYNVLKINELLVFLTGPHRGYALNLKTSTIEKTNIPEQSVVQDGKIYSVIKDRLIIRKGAKILKKINLDSNAKKKWDDDISIYNRAIFSSEPTNDNYRIVDSL